MKLGRRTVNTFASQSFRVMNPNVKHFYSAFGLEEPGPDDWSGDGTELKLYVNQLKQARVYLSKTEFYNKVDNTRLHFPHQFLTNPEKRIRIRVMY